MVRQAALELIEYIRERADSGLRTVVIIREDTHEIPYIRDDLSTQYSREGFNEVVETFRLDDPYMSPGIDSQPIGDRRAIVHYHQNAFVLQFPLSEAESILVSLSRDKGRDLLQFIENCRDIVQRAQ